MTRPLACADFTFPLLSHDASISLIASMGFDGVDIGLFENRSHLWPSREFVDVEASAKMLGMKVGDQGMRVADIFLQTDADFVPYAINHPESPRRAKAREWFLKTLDYANGCGSGHVTILPGVLFETESQEASYQRTLDELAWRVEQAKAHNITLGTEAHIGSLADHPTKAAKIIADVPGLTLTLDYTHFTRLGMPDSDVEPLVKLASHFHVRGAREGRLQARFNDNTIDYTRVLTAMNKANYQGWLGVEYVWIDWEHCNECDNVSETVLYRDFLQKARA